MVCGLGCLLLNRPLVIVNLAIALMVGCVTEANECHHNLILLRSQTLTVLEKLRILTHRFHLLRHSERWLAISQILKELFNRVAEVEHASAWIAILDE